MDWHRKSSLCALIVVFITVLEAQEQVSASFPYENEPSSTIISGNPYGKNLKLNCTIQVPEGLSLRDVNILWYRSQSNIVGKCQINLASHCSISPFSPPHLDPLVARSHFSKPLLLRNVSSTAIGCYWCRSFKCSDTYCSNHEPLGDLSTPFCLKAETHYLQKLSTTSLNNHLLSTLNSNDQLSTSLISPTTSSTLGTHSTTARIAPDESTPSSPVSSHNTALFTTKIFSSTSFLLYSSSHLSQSSVYHSHSLPSSLPHSKEPAISASLSSVPMMSPTTAIQHVESVSIQWLFVSLGVCAILAMSTCALTTITVYRCFKRRANKHRATVITSPGAFNGKEFTNIVACRQEPLSDDYYECHNTGTLTRGYYLVQQVDNDHSTTAHPTLSKIGNIFSTTTTVPSSTESATDTTDRATEEPFIMTDDQAARYEAYGYSHPPPPKQQPPDYYAMINPTDLEYSVPKSPPVPAINIYDTPTQQEDDYVYPYAQIPGAKESSQESKHEDSIGDLCEEVLQLVEKGTYEVDPQLAFVVQTQKRRQMVKEGHYQLPPPRAVDDDDVVEKEKEGHMTGGTGSGRRHNPYQSLDHTQLAENTYYTVMK